MSDFRILSLGAMLLGATQALAVEPAEQLHQCIGTYVAFFLQAPRPEAEKKKLEADREKMFQQCFTPAFATKLKKGGGDEDGFLHAQDAMEDWMEAIELKGLDLKRGRVRAFLGKRDSDDVLCLQLGIKQDDAGWRIDSSRICSKR